MENNGNILVVRYGLNIVADCIERHKEVIDELGYCWFGKIGRAPSAKALNAVFENEKGTVILYSRTGCYMCEADGILFDRPNDGYPQYYDEMLFDTSREFGLFIRLLSIIRIEMAELTDYRICSSGNPLLTTLNKSMNSFFVANKALDMPAEKKKETVKNRHQEDKEMLGSNECYFRKDGRCTRKGFVSYQFECERPSNCAGQKR